MSSAMSSATCSSVSEFMSELTVSVSVPMVYLEPALEVPVYC